MPGTGIARGAFAAPASPVPTACVTPAADVSYDVQSAFAYSISSDAILHFITRLTNAPEAAQKTVFDAAVRAASSPAEAGARTALATLCPTLDSLYGRIRAVELVGDTWTIGDLGDAKKSAAVTDVVATAIDALENADRPNPERYAAALAPFAALDVTPSAAPSAAATGCDVPNANARTLHIVQPKYPRLARVTRTTGTVLVRIDLDEAGDVRSASVFKHSFEDGAAASLLIRSAIVSATSTTYAPAVVACDPVPSTYIFRVAYK